MRITTIIPYYQNSSGLLATALTSVFQQNVDAELEVIVVDDGSPVAARDELAHFPLNQMGKITIIRQHNQGPGAARNSGLEHVSASADFVAFLDSDDRWESTHLQRAITALLLGYDVYFSNFSTFDSERDGFTRCSAVYCNRHLPIAIEGHLLGYEGHMFSEMLCANMIQTSTVVFRYAIASDLRFSTELHRSGEDFLFWLTLAQRTNRFCFSTDIEVHYGRGINVHRAAHFGTTGTFERISDETRKWKMVREAFELDIEQQRSVDRALLSIRLEFVAEVLHQVRRQPGRLPIALKRQLLLDPVSLLLLPENLVRCMIAKWRRAHKRA